MLDILSIEREKYCKQTMALEWIAVLGVGVLVSIASQYGPTYFKCHHGTWVAKDDAGLEYALDSQLHGQHLAKSVILKGIRGHIRSAYPQKALVFSLHGPVGVGKSFVANIVAEHLYKYGINSEFVHRKVGSYHFAHPDLVHRYRDQLKKWVEDGVKACARSMFIIEEVHEVPGLVIDVLKPYLDYNAVIDGVDYRKAIFFLISNTAYTDITKYTLEHLEQGGKREDITQRDMDNLLAVSVFNENGGLWHSTLIHRGMISAFVGFLPLEREHVKKCARDDARKKGYYPRNIQDKVAEEMPYYPSENPVFSVWGCKRVSEAVDRYID